MGKVKFGNRYKYCTTFILYYFRTFFIVGTCLFVYRGRPSSSGANLLLAFGSLSVPSMSVNKGNYKLLQKEGKKTFVILACYCYNSTLEYFLLIASIVLYCYLKWFTSIGCGRIS